MERSEVMTTIQCPHPPHYHNDFVATCWLWAASGGVHALLVLEPTECSISTTQGDEEDCDEEDGRIGLFS